MLTRRLVLVGCIVAASIAIIAGVWAILASDTAELNSPYAAQLPYGEVAAGEIAKCDQPPPPIVALGTASRYKPDDPTKSEIDPERAAAYDAAVKPLRDFQSRVVGWANDSVAKPKKISKAGCALIWLGVWAKGDALSQLNTGQSQFNRDQALASLALAYLQIRGVDVPDDSIESNIRDWLKRRADDVIVYYETQAGKMSRDNNHRYFAALGVVGAAIANNDRRLFDWGMSTLHSALCQATPEGALPMEMQRGSRARDYQAFALGPLVMLAEAAENNGVQAYDDCGGALSRIVDFAMRARLDPSAVEALAGQQQVPLGGEDKDRSRLAWLAPYIRRLPQSEWAPVRAAIERPSSTALGGNLGILFPDAQ